MQPHLRVARPVGDLARSVAMYREGLGLRVIGHFEDHQGFDGVMLGRAGSSYHFEFTRCRAHPVRPTPTREDLVVLYIPGSNEWQAACSRMSIAGFKTVPAFNPYWDARGKSFEDPDGYRVVFQNADWNSVENA